ncbi:unnamed protein product, partial [Coregonus sp. 'balchen']
VEQVVSRLKKRLPLRPYRYGTCVEVEKSLPLRSYRLGTGSLEVKKSLPLRSVQTNSLPDPEPTPDPTWESLQANQKTGARLQRNRAVVQDQEECLVVTPGRVCEGTENSGEVPSRTPRRTPVRSTTLIPTTTPRRTPRATAPKRRGSPEVTGVKNGGGRRQLFGRDLESVSSGLRKLKRLSHAFDDVIERDDR